MSAAWLSSLQEQPLDLMPFLEGDRRGGSTRRMRGEIVYIDPAPDEPEPEPADDEDEQGPQ